jgi:hypothetical protein
MAPDKKIKKVPNRDNQNWFRVSSMNKRKVVMRKKKMGKFQEKAKACSTSKMK